MEHPTRRKILSSQNLVIIGVLLASIIGGAILVRAYEASSTSFVAQDLSISPFGGEMTGVNFNAISSGELLTGRGSSTSFIALFGNLTYLDSSASPKIMTVSAGSAQAASATIPATDVFLGSFIFTLNYGTTSASLIQITEAGAVDATANITNLEILYKNETFCGDSVPGDAVAFNGTPGSFDAADTSYVSGILPLSASTTCVYVRADVESAAQGGEDVEIEITNPSTQITIGDGTTAPSTPVAISGTTNLEYPPATLVMQNFRFYQNLDELTPTTSTAAENTVKSGVVANEKLRLRFNIESQGGPTPTSTLSLKLQFAQKGAATSCLNIVPENFADVGGLASSTIWRGVSLGATATDGATIPSLLLTDSTIEGSYEEENPSTPNSKFIPTGGFGEWDWAIENNGASSSASYCFRATKSDGSELNLYTRLPEVSLSRGLTQVRYRWRYDNGTE